jgi:predicted PurR-regulated permease PerM
MLKNEEENNQKLVKTFTDTMIKLGVIAFVLVMCIRIFEPFIGLMLWALILAIALYPMHLTLTKKLNGKHGKSATIIVIVGLLTIGGPTIMLGNSFAEHLHGIYNQFQAGDLTISPPSESVQEWPLIGKKVYNVWDSAATDIQKLVESNKPQLQEFSTNIISMVANTAGIILKFLGSLIIAGIMMAYGESGREAMLKILERLAGKSKGASLQKLTVGTVRSVASGVIGVAFIQALLLGVGFLFAGIPGAGILAVIVMVFGILQLPAAIISIPAIAYLWMGGDASTTSNIIWSVYIVIAGLADNVLKPLLLGRGVDAPMPVILLGALGGMATAGIIGLFVGAVLLAIGYQVFMDWVHHDAEPKSTESST